MPPSHRLYLANEAVEEFVGGSCWEGIWSSLECLGDEKREFGSSFRAFWPNFGRLGAHRLRVRASEKCAQAQRESSFEVETDRAEERGELVLHEASIANSARTFREDPFERRS